jgi:hypothetical protein
MQTMVSGPVASSVPPNAVTPANVSSTVSAIVGGTTSQVVVLNPAGNEAALTYALNGESRSLQAGTQETVTLSSAEGTVITFGRGNGSEATYTLSGGNAYEFYSKDAVWEIRKKRTPEPVPATMTTTPSNPAGRFAIMNPADNETALSFTLNGEQRTLEPGKVELVSAEEMGLLLTFAKGDGNDARYTLTPGNIYQFYDNNGAWDLNSKRLQKLAAPEVTSADSGVSVP